MARSQMRPSIGRIVNYVLRPGVIRPAIIVHVWSDTCVQLQVFTDGDGSGLNDGMPNVVWRPSALQDESASAEGSWHWTPVAPAPQPAEPAQIPAEAPAPGPVSQETNPS